MKNTYDRVEHELVATDDGSHTVAIPAMGVTYHSSHGAIRESQHIFIDAGLKYAIGNAKRLSILEIGFGTGLNALLTMIESDKESLPINYVAVEKYPLDYQTAAALNYVDVLNRPGYADKFLAMHSAEWNEDVSVSESFMLKKMKSDVNELAISKSFDVIYFDAFDPVAQPEMWTPSVFDKMYQYLARGGVMVTYCSKGAVRRTLKEIGFQVEKLPGPKGKREIIRAHRN